MQKMGVTDFLSEIYSVQKWAGFEILVKATQFYLQGF